VRFGLFHGGLPSDDWPANRTWVRLAEELGFDSFWLADHPLSMRFDSWTQLAALAAVTDRIRLGTLVTCTYYRSALLLARIVADVDRISGGRVVLGIGSGSNQREIAQFAGSEQSVPQRLAAFRAMLRVLGPLLAGEEVELPNGQRAAIKPAAAQQPRVPILIGGGGEQVTLRLAARYADASDFTAPTLDELRRKYAVLRRHCEAVGRPYDSLLRTHYRPLVEFGEGVRTREEPDARGRLQLHVDPAGAVTYFRSVIEAGACYLLVGGAGLGTPDALRLFAERVIPAVTG
jgi:alkanesulfonate monooxygenase SsuD/methylene tetrahydromethanopterin reductase-like flavin-dependent oxidoreductase (luciferase family)